MNNERGKDGKPIDKGYLECDLPPYLQESIRKFNESSRKQDYMALSDDYCELQSSINVAEVSEQISEEQAWYMREKYLDIQRENL